jgi:hypothetical protein
VNSKKEKMDGLNGRELESTDWKKETGFNPNSVKHSNDLDV